MGKVKEEMSEGPHPPSQWLIGFVKGVQALKNLACFRTNNADGGSEPGALIKVISTSSSPHLLSRLSELTLGVCMKAGEGQAYECSGLKESFLIWSL